MYTRSHLVHIKVTGELLAAIDEAARANFQTRSAYIREAIAQRLNSQDQGQKLQGMLMQMMQLPPDV
jgi:metal-responsive CopG/Arc/MetJ family transcriptional regulator